MKSRPPRPRAELAGICGTAAILFLTGIWWGVPDRLTWAPDELVTGDVLSAARARLSGGWTSIYPPLHYALLSLVYLPVQAAAPLHLDPMSTIAALTLAGRSVSVAMALGTVLLVYRIAAEQAQPRAGVIAASVFAVALPLTYYAKTTNLDVPYTFWLMLALAFYTRSFRTNAPRDFYFFTAAGVAAIATKDQAYGFFVLPALYMTVGSLVGGAAGTWPGVPHPRVLLKMTLLALGTAALAFNLLFNWEGFEEHVRLITGPYSEDYRMFPATAQGQLELAAATALELGHAMSWPLLALAGAAIAARVARLDFRAAHLLLPAASYYVCFIAVVGYVYDRFLIGVIAVVSAAAAPHLEAWLRQSNEGLKWRRVLFGLALAYALARCVSLDYLMVRDSRYAAERWIEIHVAETASIAAIGRPEHLPRQSRIQWEELRPRPADLARIDPDVIVVNAAYSRRAEPGSLAATFYDTLRSGAAGYRLVETFRTPRTGLPLALEQRFMQVPEDPFSNLSKINPTIEVYVRR